MNATAKRFFVTCAACEGNGALDEPNEGSNLSARSGEDETYPCDECDDGKVACKMCDGIGTLPRRVSKLVMARAVSRLARLRRKLARLDDPKSTPRASSPRWKVPYHAGAGYWKRCAVRDTIAKLKAIISGERDCPACEGDGKVACRECDGEGFHWYSCGGCGESFENERTVYLGDGDLYCEACVRKSGAFECKACESKGEITRTDVECRGKRFPLVGASCSRCGGRPHNPGEEDTNRHIRDDAWFVVRAPLCDTDGVFYSYLCTDPDGNEGCLGDTLDEQAEVPKARKELLEVLEGCEGDDDDGLAADMEDMRHLADGLVAEDDDAAE